MDQGSFLLMSRFMLACMNIYQVHHDSATSDVVFWKPPPRLATLQWDAHDVDEGHDNSDDSDEKEDTDDETDDDEQTRKTFALMLRLAEEADQADNNEES